MSDWSAGCFTDRMRRAMKGSGSVGLLRCLLGADSQRMDPEIRQTGGA